HFQESKVLNFSFRPSKRKTTRGALDRTRPSDRCHCGLQKPEIAYSPNGLEGATPPSPPPSRVFVLPSRYGAAIVEIRGSSPRIPTNFRVRPAPRHPSCRPAAGRMGRPTACWRRKFRGRAALARDPSSNLRLLEVDLRASLFELALDLVGFFLVDTFLDGLRRAFDEVLGFLQAKTGDGADFLDDLDLLVAGRRQHDRELGLLFRRSGSRAATRRARHCDRSCGRDAPLLFQELCEFGGFEHREAREVVDDFLQVSH